LSSARALLAFVPAVADFADPVFQTLPAGHAEKQHGDEKGVEKLCFPVSEGVTARRLALAVLDPDQQQHLIARVGDRVIRLREHRGAAGQQKADEFENRDSAVCDHRCEDDTGASCHTVPFE